LQDEPTEESLPNQGLYSKVLARLGRLNDAFTLTDRLHKYSSFHFGEEAKRWAFNIAAHRHEYGAGLVAHGQLPEAKLRQVFDDLLNVASRYPPGWLLYNEALQLAVDGDAPGTRRKAEAALGPFISNQEQRASYLALCGAACEVTGETRIARESYDEILRIPEQLDNIRGLAWAEQRRNRIGQNGAHLMRDIIRTLLPMRES